MSYNEPATFAARLAAAEREIANMKRTRPPVPRFQDLADAELTKVVDGQVPTYKKASGRYEPTTPSGGGGGGALLALSSRKDWEPLGGNMFGASWSVTLPSAMSVLAMFSWEVTHAASFNFQADAEFGGYEAVSSGFTSDYSGDFSVIAGTMMHVLTGPLSAGTYAASCSLFSVNFASGEFGRMRLTVLGFVASGGSIS